MTTDTLRVPVFALARDYLRGGDISPVQSFLKHSLVPLGHLAAHLPDTGVIWDLGCGEGILTNLVARAKPNCRVFGFDLDPGRIEIARKHAAPNATFEVEDIFALPERGPINGVIMNDVVHHLPFARQPVLLADALRRLRPGGAMVLKEVDRTDGPDLAMTRFFDSKLYPNDVLCFRAGEDWRALLARLGVSDLKTERVNHPWPASRTLLLARRPGDAELYNEAAAIDAIVAGNRATPDDTAVVFVTGATGFIGGHLARTLMRDGIDGKKVRLLALTRNTKRFPIDLRAAGAIPIAGDLSDTPRLKPIFERVDYVFHLAAEVKLTNGTDLWRNNLQGVEDLLAACQSESLKRFIHASTMGAVDRKPSDPCTKPLDETVPPNPLSEYGETKLRAEKAVIASGLPYSIIRVPWGYGAGMTPDTHVRFLTQGVANGKPFSRINFPGKVSICAVDDVVDAFLMAATRPEMRNETYFVSDGRPISLGDLFKRAGAAVGKSGVARIGVPKPASAIARALRRFLPLQIQNLNSDVLCVSNAKIAALGFKPRVSQRQGFRNLAKDLGAIGDTNKPLLSVVTGAASGIGLALAEAMADDGHRLLLVDVNESALKATAERLGADFLVLDLSASDAAARFERYVADGGFELDWVVNCAGIGVRGAVGALEPGRQDRVVLVNALTLAEISRVALKNFRESGRGTLINIGSTAGFQPMPFMAAYSASKAFVQNYTRSLAGEVSDNPDIRIVLVNPTGSATGFQQNAGVKTNAGEKLMTAEEVAQRIMKAAESGKMEVTLGGRGAAMALLARALPMQMQVGLWTRLMRDLR